MSTAPTIDPTTRRLLAHLWRGGDYRYWWGALGKKKTSLWWKQGETPPALLNSQHNMYFGVHPCTAIPPTNSAGEARPARNVRSQLPYIAAVNCLFAEFDAKRFVPISDEDANQEKAARGGTLAEARERLQEPIFLANPEPYKALALAHIKALAAPPSVIIDSGGGYHCYWLFAETFKLDSDETRARADQVQKGWVKFVGSDDGAKDLARVLRVPGTHNFKPEYGPDYPAVTFITVDFERLYSFDALEALIPPEPVRPVRTRTSTPEQGDTPAATVDESADFATIAEAAGYLKRLADSRWDTYDTWKDIGMALRGLGSVGYCLWEQRSKKSTKYQPGDCAAKWPTFRVGTPDNGLITIRSLKHWAEEDDPDGVTLSGDMVPRADYEKIKAERDELKQHVVWEQQILNRADLQPTEKGLIIGIDSIVSASRNLGGNAGRVPLSYEHAADIFKTSKKTIGRGVDAGERIGIWRRDPELVQSNKGNFAIPLMRLEIQPDYDTPAVLPLVEMPKRGGARPGAGRKPKCAEPGCPPGTVHRKVTERRVSYYCPIHGLIAEDVLPDLIEDYIPDDEEINIETGNVAPIVAAGAVPTQAEINIETGDIGHAEELFKVETGDTTISMVTHFDGIARTRDQLKPYVNPDQERYVLKNLPIWGPGWARTHMETVAPWDDWPAKVHHAVHKAEGLSQELLEPPVHGARGTAVRA